MFQGTSRAGWLDQPGWLDRLQPTSVSNHWFFGFSLGFFGFLLVFDWFFWFSYGFFKVLGLPASLDGWLIQPGRLIQPARQPPSQPTSVLNHWFFGFSLGFFGFLLVFDCFFGFPFVFLMFLFFFHWFCLFLVF